MALQGRRVPQADIDALSAKLNYTFVDIPDLVDDITDDEEMAGSPRQIFRPSFEESPKQKMPQSFARYGASGPGCAPADAVPYPSRSDANCGSSGQMHVHFHPSPPTIRTIHSDVSSNSEAAQECTIHPPTPYPHWASGPSRRQQHQPFRERLDTHMELEEPPYRREMTHMEFDEQPSSGIQQHR